MNLDILIVLVMGVLMLVVVCTMIHPVKFKFKKRRPHLNEEFADYIEDNLNRCWLVSSLDKRDASEFITLYSLSSPESTYYTNAERRALKKVDELVRKFIENNPGIYETLDYSVHYLTWTGEEDIRDDWTFLVRMPDRSLGYIHQFRHEQTGD